MKHILTNPYHEVLRFDLGDDVVAGILDFATRFGIDGAWIIALGAASNVELGFFDVQTKKYEKKVFDEFLEIATMNGNISMLDGKPALHMHGSFGRRDLSTISGHVHELKAGATVEVFIHKIDGRMERRPDPKTGLNVLK